MYQNTVSLIFFLVQISDDLTAEKIFICACNLFFDKLHI